MSVFTLSPVDCLFSCVGLPLFLCDVALDVWAAVNLYQESAWVSLAVLLVLLLGSSVLVQLFSWLWYRGDDLQLNTKVERALGPLLPALHALQLGIYVRHAAVLEVSVKSFLKRGEWTKDVAVYLMHDLSMLRFFETFSESAPQVVLMLTIILRQRQLDAFTVLKALCSVATIAFTVTTYHRSMRSFLQDKAQLSVLSSVVYFLWNLLLLLPRLVALALFASVLPCFILAHFLCSWLLFGFFACLSGTDFMGSACGERLYRATVALVWYFDWFNVVKWGRRWIPALYHGFILLDIGLLCGVWCWRVRAQTLPHVLQRPPVVAGCVVALYVLGLLVKVVYYKFFHPSLDSVRLETTQGHDEVDFLRSFALAPPPQPELSNRRMRNLAENFYS